MRLSIVLALMMSVAACKRAPDHIPDLPEAPPAESVSTATPTPGEEPSIDYLTERYGYTTYEERVRIWSDGTVQFNGSGCNNTKAGRRGRLPVARVAALLDSLDRGGFFDFHPGCNTPVLHGQTLSLSVHHGARHNVVVSRSCDDQWRLFREATALVSKVVGPNPCAPGAAVDIPEFSHDEVMRQLEELKSCLTPGTICPAAVVLRAFASRAGSELLAALREPERSWPQRELLGSLVCAAKVDGAGARLVKMRLYEQAGACGDPQTFEALITAFEATDDKGPFAGLKAFPAETVRRALDMIAKDAPQSAKWIQLIVESASATERTLIAQAVIDLKQVDAGVRSRLAWTAVQLGATEPALWDAMAAAMSATDGSTRFDAARGLLSTAYALPEARRPSMIDLVLRVEKAEPDPERRRFLAEVLATLRDTQKPITSD